MKDSLSLQFTKTGLGDKHKEMLKKRRGFPQPGETAVSSRRNKQMVSQIVSIAEGSDSASGSTSTPTLLFAFGLAHFELDSPSVITLLCQQGFGVTHLPTGRDRCAMDRCGS